MGRKSQLPSSSLEELRTHYTAVELPGDLGWTAYIDGKYQEFGTCWGRDREDSLAALDCYVRDNYASADVVLAGD